jgi:hypothetical protein
MECKITSSPKTRFFLYSIIKIYFLNRIELKAHRYSIVNILSDLKKHQTLLYLKIFYNQKHLTVMNEYFGLSQKYNLIKIKL